jgi:hypothetical protein
MDVVELMEFEVEATLEQHAIKRTNTGHRSNGAKKAIDKANKEKNR